MMFKPEEFFDGFQINHFDYKQINNRRLLELSDEEIESRISDLIAGSKQDFIRSVRADIRFTFLLSIETLFELVMALLPDRKGRINDKNILLTMVQKKPNYEDIRNFAFGKASKLDLLHTHVKYTNGKKETVLRHIFYYKIWDNQNENEIVASLKVIQDSLKILAKELTNRDELNSYKHGLRGIPFLKNLKFLQVDNPNKELNLNLGDSVTFYSYNKKSKSHEFLTKSFDSERDMLLTHYVSNLVFNIIEPRKCLKPGNTGKSCSVLLFESTGLETVSKVNVEVQDLRSTHKIN